MSFAVLLPAPVGLFLLTTERFRARMTQPPDRDAGRTRGPADADRARGTPGGAAPGGGRDLSSGRLDRALHAGQHIEGRGPWTSR
jgi:hypothetical protein